MRFPLTASDLVISAYSCHFRSLSPDNTLTYFMVLAVVYDLNGREASEAGTILDALPEVEQYIFCSSAGVYKKSDEMPHREVDEGDPKSRHKVRGMPSAWNGYTKSPSTARDSLAGTRPQN